MPGTMRKMAVYLGLVEDDLVDDYDPEPRPRTREVAPSVADPRPRTAPEVVVRPTATAVAERPSASFRPTGSAPNAKCRTSWQR